MHLFHLLLQFDHFFLGLFNNGVFPLLNEFNIFFLFNQNCFLKLRLKNLTCFTCTWLWLLHWISYIFTIFDHFLFLTLFLRLRLFLLVEHFYEISNLSDKIQIVKRADIFLIDLLNVHSFEYGDHAYNAVYKPIMHVQSLHKFLLFGTSSIISKLFFHLPLEVWSSNVDWTSFITRAGV